jgi:predicted transcriptional regulator
MKKLILVFTMAYIGLNGMEAQYMNELPRELQEKIANDSNEILKQSLATSNTLDEAINAIKKLSALHGVQFDNLKGFTTLVHLLANKFGLSPQEVANKFNTPTSKKYMRLAVELIEAVKNNNMDTVTELIAQGADVNYYKKDPTEVDKMTPLAYAVKKNNEKLVKLLLDYEAKPSQRMVTEIMFSNRNGINSKILSLLLQALQKK